jgi:PIN domain nuclease of toxin-antitoxin system
LLLAQCAVEGLRLITTDRVLAQHPLAWRAG